MDLIRSTVDWIDEITRKLRGRDGESQFERYYKCVHCARTFETKPDRCTACRAKRVVPAGSAFESGPMLRCRNCRTAVDHRHELCPECGSPRFDGGA